MLCDLESRKRNAVSEQPSCDTERGVLTLLRLRPLLREVDVAPCADNTLETPKDPQCKPMPLHAIRSTAQFGWQRIKVRLVGEIANPRIAI